MRMIGNFHRISPLDLQHHSFLSGNVLQLVASSGIGCALGQKIPSLKHAQARAVHTDISFMQQGLQRNLSRVSLCVH